jgi:hypothetical protein
LKIAQSFSSGIRYPQNQKSRQGRKVITVMFSAVPAGLVNSMDDLPSHKWLGYFQRDGALDFFNSGCYKYASPHGLRYRKNSASVSEGHFVPCQKMKSPERLLIPAID